MPLYNPENTPEQNLEVLSKNPYPGRLLVMGYVGDAAVQAYAVEGRSEGSRNRILVEKEGVVSTEVFDMSKQVGDPALTLYRAMDFVNSCHVVSNGNQTTTAIEHFSQSNSFEEAMATREYEPDAPNFTPRISGYINIDPFTEDMSDVGYEPRFGISVIRKIPVSKLAVRSFFTEYTPKIKLSSGIGYAVHTYEGDDNPLPPFDEAPFAIPIEDTAQGMAKLLWKNLDAKNRVAVVAKVFTPTSQEIFIINRHKN